MDQVPSSRIVEELGRNPNQKDEDVWRIEILRRIYRKEFERGDLLSVDWSIIQAAFLEIGINLQELLKEDIQAYIKEILVYDWHEI